MSDDELAFPLGWKSIEKELKERRLKDDMVQLNGYYQYEPKINCSYTGSGTQIDDVLAIVVSGKPCRKIMGTGELADLLGVEQDDLITIAEELKRRGYEIRNHNTNPQIKEGHWLIPYAFPTLTRLSVQLRKKLR